MKNTIYIGIDPGQSGSIAIITSDSIKTFNLSNTEADIATFLNETIESINKEEKCTIHCLIEKVWAWPGQSSNSTGVLMQNYGFLRGLLIALKIPFTEITAKKWQKHFLVKTTTSKDGKTKHKNELKGKAQCIFPNIKVTLANADALLIAHYIKETSK